MTTKTLRPPSSIITLKSPLDSSISFNVLLTPSPHCHSNYTADIAGKSHEESPIHHLECPNDTIQNEEEEKKKKKKKKQKKQLSRKLSRYGSVSRGLNLKSAVTFILKKAKTHLLHMTQLSNGVSGVTRAGKEMVCVEPYFSVPVVPVMATL